MARAPAVTNVVRISSYFFTPTNITINVGDTILWTNTAAIAHDTTSPSGGWASGLLGPTGTFLRTFASTGAFFYFCQTHVSFQPGMTGNVFVVSAPVPPFVAITNPANNVRFAAPANFTLMALATNVVQVTNVQFFRDTTLLSSLINPPYQFAVANLAAGNYAFTARAVNNQGLAATSAPVSIQVLTNALLSDILVTPNAAQFTVNGVAGQSYIAEFSTNTTAWVPFSTNVAPANTFNFTNSPIPDPMRLYRVKQTLQ